MNDRLKAMLELEKRGKLPEQFAPLLQEARKRGLVPALDAPQAEPKSFGQTLRENLLGDDDPTTQNFGEKVGTALNKAGEAMTFGLIGDEASAAVESLAPGVNYADRRDHYRQQERNLERTNPGVALAAEVGGAMALPLGVVGGVKAAPGMMNLGRNMLASAATTGALSGVYGFAEGEGGAGARLNDAEGDAKIGAGIGLAIPVAGAGIQKVADALKGRSAIRAASRNAPTTAQLRAQGDAAYKAVDNMGVSIKPQAFQRATSQISQDMVNSGLDVLPGPSSLTPKSARLNQIMGEMNNQMATQPTASLPFRSVDQLRRKAGAAARTADRTDAALGTQAIEGLDDFIRNLSPGDVDAGDARAIGPAIEKARDIWSRMSRSQLIDDAIEAGDDYLSGGSSGIRNQFRRILRSDKLSRGFSDAEKQVMRKVVNGTLPEQLLNLLGGGIGQLSAIGAGLGVGGVPGALGGAALAAGARKGSEAMTRQKAEIVRAIIANGGLTALPKASPAVRQISERLMRQGTAAGVQ